MSQQITEVQLLVDNFRRDSLHTVQILQPYHDETTKSLNNLVQEMCGPSNEGRTFNEINTEIESVIVSENRRMKSSSAAPMLN